MSDTAKREPTIEHYPLSLGGGVRFINYQGEGAEAAGPDIVASPGARRSIEYRSCKLRGNIEIDGQKVNERSITAYVYERLSDDGPPWPDEPWKIGALSWRYASLSLSVSTVAFQPLWEIVDAPDDEQFDVRMSSQVQPDGLFVYEIRLEGRPRSHPVVIEVQKLRQTIDRMAPVLLWLFIGVTLVASLLQWLWRYL